MKTINHNVKLNHLLENLLRERHVLIVLQNNLGEIILGSKTHYPENFYRLIGGGIEKGETPTQAAVREIKEEVGLKVSQAEIKRLYKVKIEAEINGQTYKLITYICLLKKFVNTNSLTPGDDIQAVQSLSLEELESMIQRYNSFEPDTFWHDYGKVYGPIHRLLYEFLSAQAVPGSA